MNLNFKGMFPNDGKRNSILNDAVSAAEVNLCRASHESDHVLTDKWNAEGFWASNSQN
jgi:hypothetical protein